MTITDQLAEDLKRDEGYRPTAYPDPLSGWETPTIGIGHAMTGLDPFLRQLVGTRYALLRHGDDVLSDDEIMALFHNDLMLATTTAHNCANSNVVHFNTLPVPVQTILIEMAFQMGGGLAGFHKMFTAIKLRDWKTAATEMLDSKWAKQTSNRANRMASVMQNVVNL